MEKQINQNFIKASTLIFITAGLSLINLFIDFDFFNTGLGIAVVIITVIVTAGLALFIKRGENWAKYVFIILTILGLISIPAVIKNLKVKPVTGIINSIQLLLEIWSVILLLVKPKQNN
jgi:hypothetical protein